ncbi:hypothetical protein ISN45_At05g021880 [Arabidopsis thaliana x Arabidopsis arenosa]|jgi:hypothetical protein|uniref:Uncharacterized protein n=2 Tax=Arabidopsis TaxID=3701 RepID=B3H7E0_ARATH|nr:uncharacterized protein AT5G23411 [Arabidopsis thaliana]AED93163.1 hypothetical protein AT5G23411 [Arabidopsis thaliana]KAG7603200.1 hypothetical protein ISN45_At05g021880 [Arabidopsis thaliana x Arabidopsis arenosa]|eukprot:NP_001119265.1 hypothetical protein AT5G23411 [Arabidopsis thaliana]
MLRPSVEMMITAEGGRFSSVIFSNLMMWTPHEADRERIHPEKTREERQ